MPGRGRSVKGELLRVEIVTVNADNLLLVDQARCSADTGWSFLAAAVPRDNPALRFLMHRVRTDTDNLNSIMECSSPIHTPVVVLVGAFELSESPARAWMADQRMRTRQTLFFPPVPVDDGQTDIGRHPDRQMDENEGRKKEEGLSSPDSAMSQAQA